MLYEYDLIVTPARTVDSPASLTIKVTHGVIHQLDIFFPPGCAHLVRCILKQGGHQIFPTNSDGYLKGDGILISGKDFFPILKAPFEVEVKGWNIGSTYNHTVTIRLWMLKVWQMMPFSDQMFMLSLEEDKGGLM